MKCRGNCLGVTATFGVKSGYLYTGITFSLKLNYTYDNLHIAERKAYTLLRRH